MPSVLNRIAQYPIIPVILIDRAEDAVPLGQALIDGGLPVLEVTLRTEAALDAIAIMAKELPNGIVGAGTLRKPADVEAALKAGAEFRVSSTSKLQDCTLLITGRNMVPFSVHSKTLR